MVLIERQDAVFPLNEQAELLWNCRYAGKSSPLKALQVTVTDDTLSVELEDGRTIAVPIVWFPRLAYGTVAERTNVQISGAGYGLHWPDLDEDIGVEGLLVGKKSTESAASFAQWLAARQQITPR